MLIHQICQTCLSSKVTNIWCKPRGNLNAGYTMQAPSRFNAKVLNGGKEINTAAFIQENREGVYHFESVCNMIFYDKDMKYDSFIMKS